MYIANIRTIVILESLPQIKPRYRMPSELCQPVLVQFHIPRVRDRKHVNGAFSVASTAHLREIYIPIHSNLDVGGHMCDENIYISGDGAVPNICRARILKRPVTMLWGPRAAVYDHASILL